MGGIMKLFKNFWEWLHPNVVRDTSKDTPWFTPPRVIPPAWSLYKDKRGEWRWRITAHNGEIIGASTEGYKSKLACFNNLKAITKIKLDR
jgi:uncharacterized protein YegP (UPF0339 family)